MKLREILSPYPDECMNNARHRGILEAEISGVAYDSRKVTEGNLFVAVTGGHHDGHDFIKDAAARGAVAFVGEHAQGKSLQDLSERYIDVKDSREALARISARFYQNPSEEIVVVGITGTNGKTSTTYLIKSILDAWKKKSGLIGTISYAIGDERYPAPYTTPESLEFQGLLREMVSSGCEYVVTEVSSHALAQKRVDYTRFVVVVFTNLTRDHLDFHETMENYFTAKKRLFCELLSKAGTAVINSDDPWGRRLLHELKGAASARSVITYGMGQGADVSALAVSETFKGLEFILRYQNESLRIESPLIGLPNVYNILAAVSAGLSLNVPLKVIQEGIRLVRPIPGRIEQIDEGQEFLCIIDYAHTPDALERLLSTARSLLRSSSGEGRIITVFGCGGDRDRGKRPIMGEIATRLSDHVIITSDNPRTENPLEIIKGICSGISKDNYAVIADRKEAITVAVNRAEAGDIVLIAGKGHEDYQEIGGRRFRFSDREIAAETIEKRLKRV